MGRPRNIGLLTSLTSPSPTSYNYLAAGKQYSTLKQLAMDSKTSLSMATTLGKVSLAAFIHAGALVVTFTICLCYTLAVSNGHVPPWLPMISDCAVYSPEKYPFRLGLVVSSMLIAVGVVAVYKADMIYSRNKLALVLGLISTFCLGVVGVVNEAENNKVHSGAAVIFFFLYWFYMIIMTWGTSALSLFAKCVWGSSSRDNHYCYPAPALSWFRHLLTVVCGVALVAFVIMSQHWGKYALYIAICEWGGTFCIILFNWSFAYDLSQLSLAEIKD